jgi:hypothetical protein
VGFRLIFGSLSHVIWFPSAEAELGQKGENKDSERHHDNYAGLGHDVFHEILSRTNASPLRRPLVNALKDEEVAYSAGTVAVKFLFQNLN